MISIFTFLILREEVLLRHHYLVVLAQVALSIEIHRIFEVNELLVDLVLFAWLCLKFVGVVLTIPDAVEIAFCCNCLCPYVITNPTLHKQGVYPLGLAFFAQQNRELLIGHSELLLEFVVVETMGAIISHPQILNSLPIDNKSSIILDWTFATELSNSHPLQVLSTKEQRLVFIFVVELNFAIGFPNFFIDGALDVEEVLGTNFFLILV